MALVVGCYGGLSAGDPGVGDDGASGGDGVGEDGGSSDEGGDDGWVPPVGECDPGSVGQSTLRRLNRREYRNTVRDLLHMPTLPDFALPVDGLNGKGLDNDGDALTLDLAGAERYYDAATQVSASLDAAGARPFTACEGLTSAALTDCVDAGLDAWLTRAFRRPAPADAVELLRGLTGGAQTYDEAAQAAVVFALTSPHFLFHYKTPDDAADPDVAHRYELAGRLSYLVWSSMPDDALLAAAADGTLAQREGLEAHVVRMLEHPNAERFYADFSGVWLKFDSMASKPDAEEHPELFADMQVETAAYFEHVGRGGEPLGRLMDSGESWMNGRLAAHYGIDTTLGDDEWDLVTLPPGERSGLLTQASVLAASAGADFSDPIRRGAWIAETLGCEHLPPPPFEPPALPEPSDEDETVRELIERHTSEGACAACHAVINPYGFALENYDRMGAFRTEYDNGAPVDASGTLVTGEDFGNAIDLSQVMVSNGNFEECLAEFLSSYSVGRSLTDDELCFVELALQQAHEAQSELTLDGLMTAMVTSYLFAAEGGSQ